VSARAVKADFDQLRVTLPDAVLGRTLAVAGKGTAEADLAQLAAFRVPPKEGTALPSVSGQAVLKADASTDASGARLDLDGAIADLVVRPAAGGEPFADKNMRLRMRAAFSPDGMRVDLSEVALESSLARPEACGRLSDLKKSCTIDLDGTLALDFAELTRLLRARGLNAVDMKGCASRPFTCSGPIAPDPRAFLSFGQAQGAVFVGSMTGPGFSLGAQDLKYTLREGVLALDYSPAFNGGALRFNPTVTVSTEPMELSFPAGSRVLERVRLTEPLINTYLVYINPLLKDGVAASGDLTMTLEDFRTPLGPTFRQQLAAAARLDFSRFSFTPGGHLASVLEFANVPDRTWKLDYYAMNVACRAGRVYPDPMRIRIADSELLCTGSVGLDGNLAYAVSLPITEKIVGKMAYPYAKGIVVRIPVTGTTKSPRLDFSAAQDQVATAARKAAENAAREKLGGVIDNLQKKLEKKLQER